MKILSFSFVLFFTSLRLCAQETADTKIDTTFGLDYVSVGFGSNKWKMQPMFKVEGTRFIYTLEQAWESKGRKKEKPDTLLVGNLRKSSIDSILNITSEIKGDSVYKLNAGVMSGGVIYLDIISNKRKLSFELENACDLTARKIVDILNAYIPNELRKLWISNIQPDIIKIK